MAKSYGYSVVIPTTLNNHAFLDPCLASIREHSAGTVEIVVVLNGKDQDTSQAIALHYDAKVIEISERVGYSEACNTGISVAVGKYVIISNDDVLVAPDWNLNMQSCMDKFNTEFPECPAPAIVGPASNNAAGVQQIPDPQSVAAENYLQASAAMTESLRHNNWIPSVFISGFCMMISREFIEFKDGKPFDERLVNGAEDNLICIEAMVNGYSTVACGNAFVFHHGHKTTDRLPTEEDNARGVRNLLDFYKIGKEELFDGEQKAAACCRVRLLTEDHLRVFTMAVNKNASIADALVVLNDRSDPKLWEHGLEACEVAAAFNKIPLITKSNPERKELNECDDRQWLLDQARTQVGDVNGWYLSFDADEVWEDKFDRAYLQRLINCPHPSTLAYLMHFYTFWDEAETMWRKDGIFGAMAGHRLVRILPGQNMLVTESGMHMGNVPMCRVNAIGVDTSIRVKHYGFSTQAERQRKYDFYTEHDTVKDVAQIGAEDYSHLIATSAELVQWTEDTSVTIGTCVRNEEIALHNYLRNFWAFADNMILTDTGSDDRTVELLKLWGVEVIEYEEATGEAWDATFAERSDLSWARNLSMEKADTHWYWQIDPDEHPRASDQVPHPLAYMRRQLDRVDLDALQFFFRCIQPDGYHTLSQTPRLVSKPKDRAYFGYVHETLDKDLPATSRVDYAHLDFVHTGAMMSDEDYAEKMKRYFRGNLRMVRDYPDQARGWFNAAMHFLDSPLPEMRETGVMFMHQAVARNPDYAVGIKEIAVQSFTDLRGQLERLLELVPKGHPFEQYANEAAEACNKFGLASREMIRCPGHAEEVLQEEQFVEFLEIVQQHALQHAQGGEEVGDSSD